MAVLLQIFAGMPAKCRNLMGRIFDPYHPERHYMRGPGPRWRAKHQGLIEIRG